MITVYWSKYNLLSNKSNHMVDISLNPLGPYQNKVIGPAESTNTNWMACPGSKNFLNNMFYIRNPFGIDLGIDGNGNVMSKTISSSQLISIREYNKDSIIMDYAISLSLFSEESLSVSVMPAFFSNQPALNSYIVPGEFNISKWFRPINPSFMSPNKNIHFKINEGDPLLYVKFNTDKQIKFKEFYFTDSLRDISTEAIGTKRYKKNIGLNSLYKDFADNKINKIILKEIKKAII